MRIALLIAFACIACKAKAAHDFSAIDTAIARGDAPKTTSVLVVRGDETVYEHYFNGSSAEALHDTRSATKSLTSLSVGIALDRHVLPSLDAPAFAYLADLRP